MRTLTSSCLVSMLFAGCALGTIPNNQWDCEAQGGRWVVNVRRDTATCLFPIGRRATPTFPAWTPTPSTASRPTATWQHASRPSTPTPVPVAPTATPSRDPWEPIPFVLAAPFAGRQALLYLTDPDDEPTVLLFGDRPGQPLKIWASRRQVLCERHPNVEPHGMIEIKRDRVFLVLPDCSVLNPPTPAPYLR